MRQARQRRRYQERRAVHIPACGEAPAVGVAPSKLQTHLASGNIHGATHHALGWRWERLLDVREDQHTGSRCTRQVSCHNTEHRTVHSHAALDVAWHHAADLDHGVLDQAPVPCQLNSQVRVVRHINGRSGVY